MTFSRRLLLVLFRAVTGAVYRVQAENLERIPARGPLIMVLNHVSILELPLIYARLQPRRLRGLVLAGRWKNPLLGWGLTACECIPLERGGANLASFRLAMQALDDGEIVLIMPEGTRSHHGRLQKGYPGVALLALKSQAPLLPVVTFGGEAYPANLRRLRRTGIHLRAGEPFCLSDRALAAGPQARAEITDAIMFRLAALLPTEYRGAYAGPPPGSDLLSPATGLSTESMPAGKGLT